MNAIRSLVRGRGGFTLGDCLITLVVVGILTAIAYPMYLNVADATNKSAAISKAQTLNSAQASFKSAHSDYSDLWTGDDEHKYELVRTYIPGAPDSLTGDTGYQVPGYTYTFGSSVDTKVLINGGAIAY